MEPDELLDELGETFRKKNDDYSDTWIISGLALAALHDEPVELETVEDHIVNGNTHRLLDKVLRGYAATLIKDETNFEAASDSFEDASVYSAMLATVLADEQTERIEAAFENADPNFQNADTVLTGGITVDEYDDIDGQ